MSAGFGPEDSDQMKVAFLGRLRDGCCVRWNAKPIQDINCEQKNSDLGVARLALQCTGTTCLKKRTDDDEAVCMTESTRESG